MQTGSLAATASDTTSFESFFEAHYLRLSKAMYLLTGDHADAEDLAQEAMARVFERWDRVRHMDSAGGYATTVALNLWRRRSRRASKLNPNPSVAPDPAVITAERQHLISALQCLTPDQREALVLVGWFGYTAEEAARILRANPSSVRGRIHRARSTIRRLTEDQDE